MDKRYRQWTDANQDRVWSLALHLLGDRGEAEDVAQEAFTRLWQQREDMSDERAGPWLLRVTRNLCLDRLRQRRPQVDLEDAALESAEHGPADRLGQSRLQQRLRAAIARLQEPYRSLVILRDIQQHSYDELAGVTGLSLPQVKTYLHRARQQLKQQLLEWQT